MSGIFYYGVKVRWNDGSSEMFRYDTEEDARAAAQYQLVTNWERTKSAFFVGRRVNLHGLWRSLFG
ncbi:MAG: hypothetical protein GKS01_10625 [Alphaproteobacteria bacterium]|nr:hypothetical protein [Alphaproteobacteria bacterium]